jgi:hypothetical protein
MKAKYKVALATVGSFALGAAGGVNACADQYAKLKRRRNRHK